MLHIDIEDYKISIDKANARTCTCKVGFIQEHKVLKRAIQLSRETASNWHYYICPLCKKYHLTSK